MNDHRFPELPLCVQEYAREGLGRAPLTAGYPSRNPLINNFARNVVLCYAMGRAAKRYPAVPLLYATPPRKSVAALIGDVFGLSEVQARRIYKADGDVALRIRAIRFFFFFFFFFFAAPNHYIPHQIAIRYRRRTSCHVRQCRINLFLRHARRDATASVDSLICLMSDDKVTSPTVYPAFDVWRNIGHRIARNLELVPFI